MQIEIKVPRMGESITEATIGTIITPSGSFVDTDEELLELETDKVNQVIFATQKGIFTLSVKQGDVVKIGQTIGLIDTKAQKAPDQSKASPKIPTKVASKELDKEKSKQVKEVNEPKEVKEVKQKNEQTQEQLGIRKSKLEHVSDIHSKKGPIQKGIAKEDIFEDISFSLASPIKQGQNEINESRRKMTNIRKMIANRLVEAQHTAAMLTTFNEVDMSAIIALREKYQESFTKKYGTKLGFMSFFVKACVSALIEFPDVNSYIDGDDIVHREYYHIGIAVSTERGLMVPVVRNCDQLTTASIEQNIVQFAQKAREGTIVMDDLQGGGFTITNGGTYGSLLSTPILNPPQSAILGMHKIMKRPVVLDDQIVIRPMMYLALSYDHRIIDGKEAVQFLIHIKNNLEDPSRLLLNI